MVHLGGGGSGGAGYQTMMPTCTGQDESSVHSSHSFSVGVSAVSRAESALIALQHGSHPAALHTVIVALIAILDGLSLCHSLSVCLAGCPSVCPFACPYLLYRWTNTELEGSTFSFGVCMGCR